ncbi:reactive intermediate/imine deaminase [Paraburkholderia sp. BL6665CI2N2]|uniref:RidA family protein n=1 Tax=Paraburkholderia sp. BL6665CI2N2 TaxID=1938806 RepID=UPI00106668E2|nr:RidA family protein [Paraburkholderia sp. BL6665CI2N2]TDY17092.1 reactive intermediate/imine deaminase [Paraburkholderia sp. BL6665CI2N2]
MTIQRINSPVQSDLPISNAVLAGQTVYTSQIPRDPATSKILVDADTLTQVRQTFGNLESALRAAGGSLADVAQLTIYLTDPDDFAEMNQVYGEMFEAPFPNRATVIVKALMVPGMRIEIQAHAYLGGIR